MYRPAYPLCAGRLLYPSRFLRRPADRRLIPDVRGHFTKLDGAPVGIERKYANATLGVHCWLEPDQGLANDDGSRVVFF